jgi:hypothetical protein
VGALEGRGCRRCARDSGVPARLDQVRSTVQSAL